MLKIQTLIFDLDETLIDRTKTMRLFLECQHDRNSQLSTIEVKDFVKSVLKHQKNGYEDKHVAYKLACSELFREDSLADELFLDFKDRYGFEAVLFTDVKEALESLSKVFTLGLVTNGRARCQNAKIDYVGIRHLFKSIKISEEFGSKKPDENIFKSCLHELASIPNDCICIGDNPNNDLLPAKELGMKTIWISNDHFEYPSFCDVAVESVAHLTPVLLNRLA
ncbi:HAD family hydrolase [Rubritalea sp.]|uniref:HAD family hydrolase n=1 Tax=Rubritalea sp. TaxID=2109375 RepID=UPI003F4AAABD